MKTAALLLALVSAVVATPLSLFDNAQSPLSDFPTSYPGFDLDLSAPRLVQLDGQDEPVTMTELEKVNRLLRPPTGTPLTQCSLPDSSEGSRHQVLRRVGGHLLLINTYLTLPLDRTETPDLGSLAHLRAVQKRVLSLMRPAISWVDVATASYPAPNNTQAVRSIIDTLEIQNLRDGLDKFTSFRTRCKSCLIPGQDPVSQYTRLPQRGRLLPPPAISRLICCA